jgi:hypothetical protein
MDAEDRTNQEWTHALHSAIENVNSDLPRSVPTTPDTKLCEEMLTGIIEHLMPVVCDRCKAKQKLMLDQKGRYCHREVKGGYLQTCYAHGLHRIVFSGATRV